MPTRTDIIVRSFSLEQDMELNIPFLKSLEQYASNEGSFVEIEPLLQKLSKKVYCVCWYVWT